MKFRNLSLILFILFISFAESGFCLQNVHEQQCVRKQINTVYDHLINYANYKNLDNQIFTVSLPGMSPTPLVDMNYSGANFTRNDTTGSDAAIWVRLKPIIISDPKLYPRFMLNCTANWSADHNSIVHDCNIDHRNDLSNNENTTRDYNIHRNFGLSDFSSHLVITTGGTPAGSPCTAGQVKLDYTFNLIPQPQHLDEIRAPIIEPLRLLPDVPGYGNIASHVEEMFGENFFNGYYTRFYRAWANAIP